MTSCAARLSRPGLSGAHSQAIQSITQAFQVIEVLMSITQEERNSSKRPDKTATPDESIGTVFQNNIKPLKHYVSRFFGNSHDIEDLLQDVYIRVVEAEKVTRITTPKAFIYKVARNLALNEKSRARQKHCSAINDDELAQIIDELSLEDNIEQEQRFIHFCSSVNKLPPQCRKVFIMKKVYGLANNDIAKELDISVSTVDKHLAKALITCRNDLQKMGHFIAPAGKNPTRKPTHTKPVSFAQQPATSTIIAVTDSCSP
jgi:RNA polymerase sigma factor (sigma-70 family)